MRRRLVGGLGFEKMGVVSTVGTDEPYPITHPSHLHIFVLICSGGQSTCMETHLKLSRLDANYGE